MTFGINVGITIHGNEKMQQEAEPKRDEWKRVASERITEALSYKGIPIDITMDDNIGPFGVSIHFSDMDIKGGPVNSDNISLGILAILYCISPKDTKAACVKLMLATGTKISNEEMMGLMESAQEIKH